MKLLLVQVYVYYYVIPKMIRPIFCSRISNVLLTFDTAFNVFFELWYESIHNNSPFKNQFVKIKA